MISVDATDGAIVKIAKEEVSLRVKEEVIGAYIALDNDMSGIVLGCWRNRRIGGCSSWSNNGSYLGSRGGRCSDNSARSGVCRSSGTRCKDDEIEQEQYGAIATGTMLEHSVSFQIAKK